MHERAGPLIAAALIVSAVSGTAFAHSGATGIVRQRMDLMGEIADRMKELGAMIRGRENFDPEVAGSAADALAGHAGKMLSLFPEGSARKRLPPPRAVCNTTFPKGERCAK